ncbi:MAG TPA: ATP-binding protein [Polyangia bacterium]|nr:ATP-binding protein [Polyangia bacterium]
MASPPTGLPEPHGINFSWLIKLRWGAIAGQVVTIFGVERLMHIPVPLAPLLAIIALEFVTNVGCVLIARSGHPVEDWWAGAIMALDTLLLTGLLYLTGGPFNPFGFLYLVQIALASVILRARWTWTLVALSLAGSGFLFVDHRPLEIGGPDHMTVHLRGMWVAFGVAASFIVYFLMRVRRALAEREGDLAEARHLAARQERLASLATLAAGAAHELSTPLSTIALAAKELERHLQRAGAVEPPVEDVRLIRQQVDRCRAILERMATDAGESAGENLVPIPVGELVSASLDGLRDRPRIRVDVAKAEAERRLTLPRRAVAQAISSVLKNAQDASDDETEVVLRASASGDFLRIEVSDHGSGMAPQVLARAGEPFFTTKAPGRGMGLGLFLTRAVVERLGGQFRIDSDPGRGTTAVLALPLGAPAKIDRMVEG